MGLLSLEKSPPCDSVRNPDKPRRTTIHAIKNAINIWTRSHVAKHLAQNRDGSIIQNVIIFSLQINFQVVSADRTSRFIAQNV